MALDQLALAFAHLHAELRTDIKADSVGEGIGTSPAVDETEQGNMTN